MIPANASSIDPASLVRPRRAIRGMSAILLPFTADRQIDWDAFAAHVARTAACGLTPAVNMDTGYVQLIDDATRRQALQITRETLGGGEFVAGACVVDAKGAGFDEAAYGRQLDMIAAAGGLPVIFPSWGLTTGSDADFLARYRRLAARVEKFIGFELGTAFVPCGRVLAIDSYEELIQIPNCVGAKHSSLSRRLEWERLAVRDRSFMSSPATIWPSTWCGMAATGCSASPPPIRRRLPSVTAGGRRATTGSTSSTTPSRPWATSPSGHRCRPTSTPWPWRSIFVACSPVTSHTPTARGGRRAIARSS
jgi:hypothetical protein